MKQIKKYLIIVMALILGVAVPQTMQAAPAAPQGVKVIALSVDEGSMALVWNRDITGNVSDYNVYCNGKLVGKAGSQQSFAGQKKIAEFTAKNKAIISQDTLMHSYLATKLMPNVQYVFTVRSVDKEGNESADSSAVTQQTAPVSAKFNVKDYGTLGDGRTMDTKAVQAAIDACTKGGTVVVPAGTYKISPLKLHGNMTLEIQKGAVLIGTDDAKAYSLDGKRYQSLLFTKGSESNIRIVGEGIIDGNGWQKEANDKYLKASNKEVNGQLADRHVLNIGILAKEQIKRAMAEGDTFKQAYPKRSCLVSIRDTKNVYISGITLQNPSNHTLGFDGCTNVVVNGITVRSYDCNNGDGINFGSDSRMLTVMNSLIDTGDDGMNFAAGGGTSAANHPPVGDAWIFNNYFYHGHGAVVAGSRTGSWIEKILAEDNVIEKNEIGLRCKTGYGVGGGARDITFRYNIMKDLKRQAFAFTAGYTDPNRVGRDAGNLLPGQFKDIVIESCIVNGTAKEGILVQGIAEQPHKNISWHNVQFFNVQPFNIKFLENGKFDNVRVDNKVVKL